VFLKGAAEIFTLFFSRILFLLVMRTLTMMMHKFFW
jgi:hypothetical protein